MNNECWECKFHGTVPGTYHVKCVHPVIKKMANVEGLEILSIFGKFAGCFRCNKAVEFAGITINEHGFNHGWANFPYNFDPIWITGCKLFEKRV